MGKKYRLNTDNSVFDGKRFNVNGEEYEVKLPRRGFLKASAVVAAGGVGVGSYMRQSQPVLAADGDWSASDVEAGDSIDAVLIGSGNLELTWNNLPNDDYYIDWQLEARLTDEGLEEGSDEFEVIAEGDLDNAYEISEDETPDDSDSGIDFFGTTTSVSSSNFTLDTDEYDEYNDTGMISLSDEHPAIEIDDFQLAEEESEVSTEVELQLTIELQSDALDDDPVTSAVVLDTFDVIIESSEDAEATIDGTAGTDYD